MILYVYNNYDIDVIVCFWVYGLLYYQGGQIALIWAAVRGYTETVQVLLSYGADVNMMNDVRYHIYLEWDIDRHVCINDIDYYKIILEIH